MIRAWWEGVLQGARGMRYTEWTWIAVGLELLIVEVVALVRGDPLLTDAMRAGSIRWVAWPALFGVFCGHFFGARLVAGGWAPWILVGAGAAVIVRDLFDRSRVPTASHLEIFLVALVAGAALFGAQARR